MNNLPVNDVLPELKSVLLSGSRVVLQAPPGAGKTTLVPIALLDETWLNDKLIIMLEPRRLAARNAASRMASLLGETPGETVGYQIKMERCFSQKTRIFVVTEGILIRYLQADPALEDVALIIFDEFHERSLHADLSLALSLQSQELLRPELKLLVMSATLAASAVSQLLEDAPVIRSEGRSFPVETVYLEARTPQPDRKTLNTRMSTVVIEVLREEKGDILVFLPGAREIRQMQNSLNEFLSKAGIKKVVLTPLYGALSKDEQDRAILPAKNGYRKIVLSTNIAETSLTIEGIATVIDSGLERMSVFNPGSGMNRLETMFIAEDSAIQRCGRAGRLSEGKCYRLWHKGRALLKHIRPELLSADLTTMMLELAQWGISDPEELAWLDLPPKKAVEHAVEMLKELLMLSDEGVITEHGKAAQKLGLHPRLAHMMLRAKTLDYAYEASLLAALLSEGDIFRRSRSSDILARLTILHRREFVYASVDRIRAERVLEEAALFEQRLGIGKRSAKMSREFNTEIVGVLLGFAYPDRIARCRGANERRYLLSNGKGAILDSESEQVGREFLAVAELDGGKTEARIFLAADLTLCQIEQYFSEQIRHEVTVGWNGEAGRVESREKTIFLHLLLDEKQSAKASSEAIAHTLIEAIRSGGLDRLPWTKKSLQLRQRVNFLNAQRDNYPKLLSTVELPDFTDAWLLEMMHEWLLPSLEGVSDLKGCQRLDMTAILMGMISWEQRQHLEALAPAFITVPSGSKIAIDYEDVLRPILAVRLQELFGQKETPAVLKGEFPLLIHLLSPAYRPMQVTSDLKSFWREVYYEVKKELRGKYKKHYWPDDPLTAQATNKTKKHMR